MYKLLRGESLGAASDSSWSGAEHHTDDNRTDAAVLEHRNSLLEDQRRERERHYRISTRQRNHDRNRPVAAPDHHTEVAAGHHPHGYERVQILACRVRSLPALEESVQSQR